jgi:2-polyprenyl-3-methyl-5-hydroxy-6-metoxy-1,4-benzoquinol methylase
MVRPTLHCPCDRRFDELAFSYDAPPPGETRFDLGAQPYRRTYLRCSLCGHWYSEHAMNLGALYAGAYVESTYGDRMRQTFEHILALPPDKSDNSGRVARLIAFAAMHLPSGKKPRLLDVGTGLGVFPFRMKEAGWVCTTLDPDPRAATHAREVVGVDAIAGDFMAVGPEEFGRFDVVTFNKVLEHVEDPVMMLAKAAQHLAPGGFVYVEVPDGEAAAAEGPAREEFFVEHHHVFSPASLATTAARAGFSPIAIERLREPSTKFTLRAFLTR